MIVLHLMEVTPSLIMKNVHANALHLSLHVTLKLRFLIQKYVHAFVNLNSAILVSSGAKKNASVSAPLKSALLINIGGSIYLIPQSVVVSANLNFVALITNGMSLFATVFAHLKLVKQAFTGIATFVNADVPQRTVLMKFLTQFTTMKLANAYVLKILRHLVHKNITLMFYLAHVYALLIIRVLSNNSGIQEFADALKRVIVRSDTT